MELEPKNVVNLKLILKYILENLKLLIKANQIKK